MSSGLIAADVLGLLGSLLLAAPAYRLSQYLRRLEAVHPDKAVAPDSGNPGPRLLRVMQGHVVQWSRVDHYLLLTGVALLLGSFLVSLATNANWL
ncbi:MAG: hypothetical protein CMQ43_01635 [Gammaproteobacteria bacterium]|nr:hypothetical protein [Gammaproteobacteria bacterium]MBK79607.1 hypothetical protein [Gammaproteobacteria bacterium]